MFSVQTTLIAATGALWVLVFIAFTLQRKSLAGLRQARVQARSLLTGNEREFFGRLNRAVGDEYRVLPQVAMGALLEPRVGEGSQQYWAIRRLFAQKIVDFVICTPTLDRPLLAVELDDKTHDKKRHKDAERDALMLEAGIPTLRWDSRNKPSVSDLRRDILAKIASTRTI